MLLSDEREAVAQAGRRLAAEGLVAATSGNVSVRTGGQVAISPTGATLAALTAEQVAVVALDGTHLDGELAATSEVDLHLGVYERYEAGAVIHTHAPLATALSCVLDELPCIHYEMLRLGGSIRVAPYRTFGSPELAAVTVDALEGRAAALMANHGAITHGHDLDGAVQQTLLLEWACTLYQRAAAVGTPRPLGPEDQQAVIAAAVAKHYGTTRKVTT